jgi:hypothetical protein
VKSEGDSENSTVIHYLILVKNKFK